MMGWYYRLRRRLGLQEISAERLRLQEILQPGKDSRETLLEEDRDRLKKVGLCLGAGVLLTVLLAVQGNVEFFTSLTRPGYGEDPREEVLDLALEEEEFRIPVMVDSQIYGSEELEDRLEEAWRKVQTRALAGNADWEHIMWDLDFSEETGVPGVLVRWSSGDVDVVSVDGTVSEPPEENGTLETELTAVLVCQDREEVHRVPVRVLWPDLAAGQRRERSLRKLLEAALADREKGEVTLPDAMEGTPIRYQRETGGIPPWLAALLAGLAAAALWALPEQRRQEAVRDRNRELALSYSELVWKLTVLLGAGMTVKGAWDRILRTYRTRKEQDGVQEVLYEEMQIAWNAMNQGIYEEKAYAMFGRRCGLQPYLRLGSLLETNVRQGRKGLAEQMQAEAENAFRERLQLAKRQGEEASSRLLMPMLLLFGLVLVILMVPALSQFG